MLKKEMGLGNGVLRCRQVVCYSKVAVSSGLTVFLPFEHASFEKKLSNAGHYYCCSQEIKQSCGRFMNAFQLFNRITSIPIKFNFEKIALIALFAILFQPCKKRWQGNV